MEIIHNKDSVLEKLSQFELFRDSDPKELQWLIDKSEYRCYPKGELIFEDGAAVNEMMICIEGEWVIKLKQNGKFRDFNYYTPGSITGALPYSRLKTAKGYGEVTKTCRALVFHKKHFPELGTISQDLMQTFVSVMTTRVREFEQISKQNEKLMALGKLSAGLAHELNNPASAMVRSAIELRNRIHQTPERFKAVTSAKLNDEQINVLNEILFSKITHDYVCTLSVLEREDVTDELVDWLEDHDVPHSEDIAVTFVEAGIKQEELELIASKITGQELAASLWWMENTLNNERLIKEIQDSADRISKLVQSVKSYSHMDRGQDKDYVDIHEGLRSTAIMLKHKMKEKKIHLCDEYASDLPKVYVYVSEMNQVWTNLIVNAIDAMEEGGTLTIRTCKKDNDIWVQIIDTGKGIPKEIQSRIFEPFFTTKGIGKGTGMGLDIAYKIVKIHQGDISFQSTPGKTVFTVCLPIDNK